MTRIEILTFGESMMSLSTNNQVRISGTYHSSVAGAESNVAIGLSRLGHDVAWVGVLGDDEPGKLVKSNLLGEGVKVISRLDPERRTGLMLKENRVGSRARVIYYRKDSAASTLGVNDVLPNLKPDTKLIHVSGITPALHTELAKSTLEVILAARKLGILVSFDVNYRSLLWNQEEAVKVLRPILELANVITASEEEIRLFGSESAEQIAEGFLQHEASLVAIKRGARGATLMTSEQRVEVEAYAVEVKDPIGAGDAFCAGLISGLIQKQNLMEMAELASACGAFCVGNIGDWEGAPTPKDVAMLSLELGDTMR